MTDPPKTVHHSTIIGTSKQIGRKIGRHANDYGLDPSSKKDQDAFVKITVDVVQNYDEVRRAPWKGQKGECIFFIKGDDAVVVCDGKYVSTLKGGANNARIKNARRQKIQ